MVCPRPGEPMTAKSKTTLITIADVPAPMAADDDYAVDEDQPLIVGRRNRRLGERHVARPGDPRSRADGDDCRPAQPRRRDRERGRLICLRARSRLTSGSIRFTYRANSEILARTPRRSRSKSPRSPIRRWPETIRRRRRKIRRSTIDLVANDFDPDGALGAIVDRRGHTARPWHRGNR